MKEVIDKIWELFLKKSSEFFELANTRLEIPDLPLWIVFITLFVWWYGRKHHVKK